LKQGARGGHIVHLVGYGGDCPLWTAWEEPDRHCWTLLSTTSPSGVSNSEKTAGSTTWRDSSAWQRSTTHCKHDESGHSGTRLGDSSTSALFSGPWPIELSPLPLSLQQSAHRGVFIKNHAELQDWLDDFYTAKPADFFKSGIENLSDRWDAVVNNGGEYIIDWLFDYLCEK
jgi:hypothetical protein